MKLMLATLRSRFHALRRASSAKRLTSAVSRLTSPLRRHWRGLLALAGLLLLLGGMAYGYQRTLHPLWVEIDGQTLLLRTHTHTVAEALREARIQLQAADRVEPPPDTPLPSASRVRVLRARLVRIVADGGERTLQTLALSVGEVLAQAGVSFIPEDRITLGGKPVAPDQPLYAGPVAPRRTASRGARLDSLSQAPAPVEIAIQRAVPIGVQDGSTPLTFLTTAPTLGEALLEKGIILYAADNIQPALEMPVRAGLRAFIDRSRPVTILADGQVLQTRTRVATVAEVLKEEKLSLGELDYTRPLTSDPIVAGMRITLVRVRERELVEQESIPYELEYRGNPDLEIDQQRVDNWGAPGVFKRSQKVRYENGIEVSRALDKEWVEKPPQNRIISYGQKIVERQITTPDGTFTYWRKMRVLVTGYTAASCGKTRDDPTYGITRLGLQVHRGHIAIDPVVIPFWTEMYVPGYGKGVAVDTGSMIQGMHIDLAYEEDNYIDWLGWLDIYLLSPAPPRDKIRWILPDYPREH